MRAQHGRLGAGTGVIPGASNGMDLSSPRSADLSLPSVARQQARTESTDLVRLGAGRHFAILYRRASTASQQYREASSRCCGEFTRSHAHFARTILRGPRRARRPRAGEVPPSVWGDFPPWLRRLQSLSPQRSRCSPESCRPSTLPQSVLGEGEPLVPSRVGAALNSALDWPSIPHTDRAAVTIATAALSVIPARCGAATAARSSPAPPSAAPSIRRGAKRSPARRSGCSAWTR